MKCFQQDQCSNHADFRRKCNKQGLCIVRRLPGGLINQDDDVVLTDLLAKDAPIITMDFTIVYDNHAYIPAENPGIIVVKARPNKAAKMEAMIAKFKRHFPEWNSTDWSKIYIEIEESEVYVSRLTDGNIDDGKEICFSGDDFLNRLRLMIAAIREGCASTVDLVASEHKEQPP
jgi:hypothetical protein